MCVCECECECVCACVCVPEPYDPTMVCVRVEFCRSAACNGARTGQTNVSLTTMACHKAANGRSVSESPESAE